MAVDPTEQLLAGAKILEPIMGRYGFQFKLLKSGSGSGGAFACGHYVNGDRRLELHYRYGLGMVIYRAGKAELSHRDYVERLGVLTESQFVWNAKEESLSGFDWLREDIERFCRSFLIGQCEHFDLS